MDNRREELRANALRHLREHEVLMLDGHFDYGNGFHGSAYLNPHRIFRQPSLIWRLAQDLIVVLPDPIIASTEVVAGPVMGGALLAHTIAGLLDARRSLTHPATQFAPLFTDGKRHTVREDYLPVVKGRKVLLADDMRNTGQTFARSKAAIEAAGGIAIASVQICDRMEATVDIGVPNFALTEYKAPENYQEESCPLCKAGKPVTRL